MEGEINLENTFDFHVWKRQCEIHVLTIYTLSHIVLWCEFHMISMFWINGYESCIWNSYEIYTQRKNALNLTCGARTTQITPIINVYTSTSASKPMLLLDYYMRHVFCSNHASENAYTSISTRTQKWNFNRKIELACDACTTSVLLLDIYLRHVH